MDDVTLARAVHVVSVVLWIGGVGFVTTVLLPTIRRLRPEERIDAFESFERPFSWQAKISVTTAGLSGFYMVYKFDMWDRFASVNFWWMDAMLCLWLVFTLMLFVVEPFFIRRRLSACRAASTSKIFARIYWMHQILFVLSLLVVFAAVGGAHGLF